MRSREEIDRQALHDEDATYTSKLELEVLLDIRDAVTSDPHSGSVEGVYLDDQRLNTVTRMAFIHLNDLRTKAKAAVEHQSMKAYQDLRDELRRQGVIE